MHDNRLLLDSMLFVLRAGCPESDRPERYGKWETTYVRFRRQAEQGIWDVLSEMPVELGLTEVTYYSFRKELGFQGNVAFEVAQGFGP